MTIPEKAIQAASTALAECGYDFPMPVDGDLDDEERGRYEALVAALTAAAPFMAAPDIDRMRAALTGIAMMDVYTRPGEEPAIDVMRAIAKAALVTDQRNEVPK